LASDDLLGRSDRTLVGSADLKWVAIALVIGAITFNAVLCLINTSIAPIHNSYVVGSEVVIVAFALLACRRTIEPKYVLFIGAVILYTALLALLRSGITPGQGFNLKISRDFLIPIIFLLLGKAINDIKVADYTVYVATALILAFALFEFFDLDAYLRVFRVTEYYVARGTLDAADSALQWASGLMVSGMRPPEQGRNLLPILGNHRVSSLFLEPIGLGNFGCLVALWAIARSKMERQVRVWSLVAGIALIILSDGRFSASFLGVGILILLISPRVTTPVVLAMPFVLIFGLWLAAASSPPSAWPFHQGLSLQERLLYSGRVLLDFDVLNWLGIEASRGPTADAGYAYVISSVGLIGFTAFWFWLVSIGGRSSTFSAFRNASAAYYAALLCISTSQFTIKTAAFQWFLMGALSVASDSARSVQKLRRQRVTHPEHEHRPACGDENNLSPVHSE
jgi:putative polymerase